MSFSPACFQHTPTLTVSDNRGLAVRAVAFLRHPDIPDVCGLRITRHHHDPRGFLTRSADPRLHDAGLANFTWRHALSGAVLRTQGADSGTALALSDAAGRPFIAVSNIRTARDGTEDTGQAVTRTWQYEGATLPGRPVSITEQATGEAPRVAERFVYAGRTAAEQGLNLAGACVSHHDTAGLVRTDSIALTGVPLSVTRRLLKEADNPDVVAGRQGAGVSVRNGLLADGAHTTLTAADAAGAVLATTDAKGNRQRVAYDVAGRVAGRWLTVKGGTEQVIVRSLTYSAAGQTLREEHGNGVVTTYTYEAETQRLTGIKTARPDGHPSGARVLQDLRYGYDPAGNVLSVRNDAEETRFWRNQKVVPESTYAYDSLYRLVRATGREMANAGQQGSHLPAPAVPLPADGAAYTNYTRTYTYDAGDNLTQIRHHAPATGNAYTTNITLSDRSNRGVLSTLTADPADVEALFTAGGQQTQLQPGQALAWNARNELQAVTPVVRDGDRDDRESYRYGAQSQRVLKVSEQKTGSGVQTRRVVYLPGLELRSTHRGDAETERLQVMTAGEAGRAQVRVLHWTSGRPDGISNDQVRYSHDNLTGSSGLEVDGDGRVISMEEYYPYGGTAVWTARSAAEADYKTLRHSGKERDATGLYYYGYRYYQPWSGRWLSADPAGTVDGLNLFRMCRNNPVTLKDEDGRFSTLKMPLDIFIHDVENLRATTSSTEFHELFLNNQGGLEVSELYSSPGLTPSPVADDTRPYNQDVESAFVIFQDNSGKARLFVNPEEEHMAINPDMGMPIFAGRLQRLAGDKGYRITNESGHYKTPANTDVLSMLRSANPDANLSNFKYEPYDFGEVDRMDDIFATPGEFRRKVDEYRLNKKSFHAFLMEVGRERIKKTGPYGMMVYRKMFTKTTETQTDEPSFVQWAAKDAGWVFPEHYLDYNPVRMSKYFDNLYNGNVTVKKSFLGKKKEKIRGPHFSPFNH